MRENFEEKNKNSFIFRAIFINIAIFCLAFSTFEVIKVLTTGRIVEGQEKLTVKKSLIEVEYLINRDVDAFGLRNSEKLKKKWNGWLADMINTSERLHKQFNCTFARVPTMNLLSFLLDFISLLYISLCHSFITCSLVFRCPLFYLTNRFDNRLNSTLS